MRIKKTSKTRKFVQPDPVYSSPVVTKLINNIMKDGKKTVAARQVYKALDLIKKEVKKDPLEYLNEALDNLKPELEVRSRRVGGATYQVPTPVRIERKQALAIRWLTKAASDLPNKTYHSFAEKLSKEIIGAHENEGAAIKKKVDTHKMAEANRAFAHFRW